METNSEKKDVISDNPSVVIIKSENICTQGRHPEDILSNLCGNDFCFDDVQCGSMEALLQSLKVKDEQLQRKICLCKVRELKWYSIPEWDGSLPLWWKGREINRHSAEYTEFLGKAYQDMFLWCARFRNALMSTEGKQLVCNSGKTDKNKDVLTDQEFCDILTSVREENSEDYKKYIYPRMWPNSYGVDEDYEY